LAEPTETLYLDVALVPEARKIQDARRAKHAWEEVLRDRTPEQLGAKKVGDQWRVHTSYLLETYFGFDLKSTNPAEADRVSKTLMRVMRAMGWEKPQGNIRIGSRSASGYILRVPELEGPKAGVEGVRGCEVRGPT
jgi:hypothetical protein